MWEALSSSCRSIGDDEVVKSCACQDDGVIECCCFQSYYGSIIGGVHNLLSLQLCSMGFWILSRELTFDIKY